MLWGGRGLETNRIYLVSRLVVSQRVVNYMYM